ncbi:MAG: hypothetical protein EXS43_11965 [Opitutus sp.]|nr:hypothetical protein [Opitutus sp.]
MSKQFYPLTRDLHLYVGLFLSPFILVFAISVFFLVHSWVPGSGAASQTRNATELTLPADFEQLKGPEQLAATRTLLDQIGVAGEIWNLRYTPRDRRMAITVNVPGRETVVDLNVAARTATITRRDPGMWDAMIYLHKLPGPHLVAIRGNSAFMQVWRWLADATVYLVIFLTLSGVYLWAVLRAERRLGLVLLAAGALSFGGLVYAVVG